MVHPFTLWVEPAALYPSSTRGFFLLINDSSLRSSHFWLSPESEALGYGLWWGWGAEESVGNNWHFFFSIKLKWKSQKLFFRLSWKKTSKKKLGFRKEDFIYDKDNNHYTCLTGKHLKTNGNLYIKNREKHRKEYTVQVYKLPFKTCNNCPFKLKCAGSANLKKLQKSTNWAQWIRRIFRM